MSSLKLDVLALLFKSLLNVLELYALVLILILKNFNVVHRLPHLVLQLSFLRLKLLVVNLCLSHLLLKRSDLGVEGFVLALQDARVLTIV